MVTELPAESIFHSAFRQALRRSRPPEPSLKDCHRDDTGDRRGAALGSGDALSLDDGETVEPELDGVRRCHPRREVAAEEVGRGPLEEVTRAFRRCLIGMA